MAKEIPSRVMELINNPQSVKILSTCSVENSLHSVPLGSLSAPSLPIHRIRQDNGQ